MLRHAPTGALLIKTAGRKLDGSNDTAFNPELIELLESALAPP